MEEDKNAIRFPRNNIMVLQSKNGRHQKLRKFQKQKKGLLLTCKKHIDFFLTASNGSRFFLSLLFDDDPHSQLNNFNIKSE